MTTYRCCVHCDDDPVHDIPNGHVYPCAVRGCIEGRRERSENVNELREIEDTP